LPDWIVHVAVAWTVCRVFRFRYQSFDPPNTAIAMVGSVIPDLMKLSMIFEFFGMDGLDYLIPLHLPVGSVLLAAIISLLFEDKKTVFLFLALGLATHFLLDLLLMQINGGMYLLFPFSWQTMSLNLVPNDDYYLTIVAIFVALSVYIVGKWWDNKKGSFEAL
jgi:hypothetical protein